VDVKGGAPQLVASLAAEKATAARHTLLSLRCHSCGSEIGTVRRSPRGLLFRADIPTSPKELGLMGFKEAGKQAGERWQKGVKGLVVDLINVNLGPHPALRMRCRRHGEAVTDPVRLRVALAEGKRVLSISTQAQC
jgi:hypothetical protein